MSRPLRPAEERSERTSFVAVEAVVEREREHHDQEHERDAEPASAQNVRVVRSFRSSARHEPGHAPASGPPVSSRKTLSSDWRGR